MAFKKVNKLKQYKKKIHPKYPQHIKQNQGANFYPILCLFVCVCVCVHACKIWYKIAFCVCSVSLILVKNVNSIQLLGHWAHRDEIA